jgi:hypothetical protein
MERCPAAFAGEEVRLIGARSDIHYLKNAAQIPV